MSEKTLNKWIPDAVPREDLSSRVRRYLHVPVVKEYQTTDPEAEDFAYWLGTGANVYFWVLLENGYGVGWNESPTHGWGFYVMSKNQVKESLEWSNYSGGRIFTCKFD